MTDERANDPDRVNSELELEYWRVAAEIATFDEWVAYFPPGTRPDFATEAAGRAREELTKELTQRYFAGDLPEGFNWRAWFRKTAFRRLLDVLRKNGGDPRAEPLPSIPGNAASESDFEQLVHSNTTVGGEGPDFSAQDVVATRFERSFYTSLAWRIVEVLSDRDRSPSLSAPQADALRLLFAEDGELDPTPAGEHWRKDLAQARGVDRSIVTQDVKKGELLIRTGLYLFVTLAPPTHVVTRRPVMDALFSAVFLSDRDLKPHHLEAIEVETAGLSTTNRKALQTAGAHARYGEFRFPVDRQAFLAAISRLNAFAALTDVGRIQALHTAESRYALLVPGQRVPSTFSCILHCATHTTGIES